MRYTIPAVWDRERRHGQGDIRGPTRGDFTDWDSPEDEDWAEGEEYLEDDVDYDDYLEFDPDDPDYDLSEAAGYAGWEPQRRSLIPEWLVVTVSLLLILALLLPILLRFA